MSNRDDKSFSLLGAVFRVFALPCNFVAGVFTGLLTPVAAIAAIVAGIRLVTGKVPFLGHVWMDEEGGRHLSFKLVSPHEAKELFDEQREQIGGDISKMKAEIQAIIEESRTEAGVSAQQES